MVETSDASAPRLPAQEAKARRDWHNEYAEALLELRAALLHPADDASRRRLLGEVRRVIDAHRGRQRQAWGEAKESPSPTARG